MPELPEVEIAARNLRAWGVGARVTALEIHDPRVVGAATDPRGHGSAARLTSGLVGRRIDEVTRRGKWLRLRLDDGARLFSHLGMTGKWVRRAIDAPTERFERARVVLVREGEQRSLRYRDPRLFGRLVLAREDLSAWRALGPDPLVDGIDVARLATALAGARRSIKEALMDQAVLAGLGNIQATEALWLARIDPRRRAGELSRAQLGAVARAIEASLRRTLDAERAEEITYVEEVGADNPFLVYGRHGAPCPRCRGTLERFVLGGRGTFACRRCQRGG